MAGNIKLDQGDFLNPYTLDRGRRRKSTSQRRKLVLLAVAFVVVLFAVMVLPATFLNSTPIGDMEATTHGASPAALFDQLRRHLLAFIATVSGSSPNAYELEICKYLIVAVSGMAMALCGTVYQAAFRNPMAAPKTLGVMSGGTVGSVLWVTWGQYMGPGFAVDNKGGYSMGDLVEWLDALPLHERLWVEYGQAILSVIGCLVVVAMVVGIAALVGHGKISNITLIIGGQIFIVAITTLVNYLTAAAAGNGLAQLSDELKSIETQAYMKAYTYVDLLVICVPILVCVVVILLMRNRLALLTFGDEEAHSMGLSTNRTRYAMIAVCTVMVGWTISFCGHVAFLGFISAHLTRKIMGNPDVRYLLPASLFVGAIFIMVVHYFTTLGFVFAPQGTDGMWVSIMGSCAFLYMVLSQRKENRSDWL